MRSIREWFNTFFHQRRIGWKTDIIWLVIFLLIVLVFVFWNSALPTQEEIDTWTSKFGSYGPLAIIGIIILETVIAPIPGTVVPIVIGALYGIWPGILLAWIGNVIGSIIAFWIARKLGRPVVLKIISEKKIEKYDEYLHRRKILLWVAYFIPLLPLDVISFVIGLSQIRFRYFLGVITVGFTGNLLILTFFGERLVSATGWEKVIWAVVTMLFLFTAIVIERSTEKKNK